jgi:hypothetical protein
MIKAKASALFGIFPTPSLAGEEGGKEITFLTKKSAVPSPMMKLLSCKLLSALAAGIMQL